MWENIDEEVWGHLMMSDIVYHQSDESEVISEGEFITQGLKKYRRKTTKGCKLLVKLEGRVYTWKNLKGLK